MRLGPHGRVCAASRPNGLWNSGWLRSRSDLVAFRNASVRGVTAWRGRKTTDSANSPFPRGWFMVADAEELKERPLPRALLRAGVCAVPRQERQGRHARCLLPAHGHAPGAQQHLLRRPGRTDRGRLDPLPVPRLALRPGRQVQRHPLQQGPDPEGCLRRRRGRSWRAWARSSSGTTPKGGEPEWEAPSLPQWNDPQWVRWKFDHLGVINCHAQEVVDNIADCSHLARCTGRR